MDWIKFSDTSLASGWYIAYCEGLKRTMYYSVENGCWLWYCDSGEVEIGLDEVSHYMPLPADPTE